MADPTSMIERMAFALWDQNGRPMLGAEPDMRMFRTHARAALAAMREPTEQMVEDGADMLSRDVEANHREVAKDVWRAMVASALTEGD